MNAQTSTGDTALTYACENGHTEVADLLLKYGAELEHESEGGRTPLMKAARAGHLSTVSFLLKRGAEVNRATANNDHTPLSLACAGGHQGVVEVLLQHGADPFHKLKVRIANVHTVWWSLRYLKCVGLLSAINIQYM